MIKVRRSVFETNSSSNHSLSIGDGGYLIGLTPDEEGKICLTPHEYGWEHDVYDDPISKLIYLWIYAEDWSGPKREEHHAILAEMVRDHTGGELVMNRSDCKYYPHGYIDHQSVEDCRLHYLFEDREQLRQFAFGSSSTLETGNDNY